MASLSVELATLGLIHQMTDPDPARLLDDTARPLTFYNGFDPTADSLHVGSLLPMMQMRRLVTAGHRGIAVVGGGTGLIGDPSGKQAERPLMTSDEVDHNVTCLARQLRQVCGDVEVLDNGAWLRMTPLTDFLRDVGKHFSVNEMIRKDAIRARLEEREQGISFTEFSYMLLQAYDFLRLFEEHGCTLQSGGSDQWGNIVEGVELIRRVTGAKAYGVTFPLVVKPDGTKFGKTESGTVWLDPARTSPYAFYQFWIRTPDVEVPTFLRWFTEFTLSEIEEFEASLRDEPGLRKAPEALAVAVTTIIHGSEVAALVQRASQVLFSEEIAGLDEETLTSVLADVPHSLLPADGADLVSALVVSGLCKSRGDARTTVEQGGAYVNNARERDGTRILTAADGLHGRFLLLRKGQRNQHVLRARRGE